MTKFLSNFVLLSSTLIFLTSFAVYTTYQEPRAEKYNGPRIIYQDEEGEPKYSQGSCKADSDCTPAGCSSQICSNDPSLVTDCAIREDFPDKNIYGCGCIEAKCVWYK
jgi:eight-cysteine-cluster-containing protein